MVFLDVQQAYDKEWFDGNLRALNQNGVIGKKVAMTKKHNAKRRAIIHTRQGLARDREIRESIRQRGVRPISDRVRNTNGWDSQGAEEKQHGQTKQDTQLNTLLWMDGVCVVHYDLTTLQEMLDINTLKMYTTPKKTRKSTSELEAKLTTDTKNINRNWRERMQRNANKSNMATYGSEAWDPTRKEECLPETYRNR